MFWEVRIRICSNFVMLLMLSGQQSFTPAYALSNRSPVDEKSNPPPPITGSQVAGVGVQNCSELPPLMVTGRTQCRW